MLSLANEKRDALSQTGLNAQRGQRRTSTSVPGHRQEIQPGFGVAQVHPECFATQFSVLTPYLVTSPSYAVGIKARL